MFPGACAPSIIGPGGLNFRVRDGNGWNPSGMITRCCSRFEARCARFELELFSEENKIKELSFIAVLSKLHRVYFLVKRLVELAPLT